MTGPAKDKKTGRKERIMEINWRRFAEGSVRQTVLYIMGGVAGVLLTAVILCNLLLIASNIKEPNQMPAVWGIRPAIVLSGSMEPAFRAGDVILLKKTKTPEELEVGDVACYLYSGKATTHRIIERFEADGKMRYIMKGDANNIEDRLAVDPEQIQGVWTGGRLPGLGRFLMFLQSTMGMFVFLICPLAALLSWDILKRRREERSFREDGGADGYRQRRPEGFFLPELGKKIGKRRREEAAGRENWPEGERYRPGEEEHGGYRREGEERERYRRGEDESERYWQDEDRRERSRQEEGGRERYRREEDEDERYRRNEDRSERSRRDEAERERYRLEARRDRLKSRTRAPLGHRDREEPDWRERTDRDSAQMDFAYYACLDEELDYYSELEEAAGHYRKMKEALVRYRRMEAVMARCRKLEEELSRYEELAARMEAFERRQPPGERMERRRRPPERQVEEDPAAEAGEMREGVSNQRADTRPPVDHIDRQTRSEKPE